ncbi:hypothetical protein [Helicobacter pylori]|uniref:hypothetical protein n=1 Tax=Helicobacter pylori TaxID=210 RepID=UPI001F3CEA0D|nr:hypothetical protein [Helicobacter pylori]
MTKQKKPIFKNKSFSNRAKNSVIKKFKILTLFLKTSPKIGDRVVFNGCFLLGVLTNP